MDRISICTRDDVKYVQMGLNQQVMVMYKNVKKFNMIMQKKI